MLLNQEDPYYVYQTFVNEYHTADIHRQARTFIFLLKLHKHNFVHYLEKRI